MKKILFSLCMLFTLVILPISVSAAAKLDFSSVDCDNKNPKIDVANKTKTVTCTWTAKNTSTETFKGTTLTVQVTKKGTGVKSYEFKPNSPSVTQKDNGNADQISVSFDDVNAGESIILGEFTILAENNGEDCSLGFKQVGEDTKGGGSSGGGAETGYAIPYVALALGLAGVVTVLATSRKKTKMYKI